MHFGHYYLTRGLEESNKIDKSTRIVNTASGAAMLGGFDSSFFTNADAEGDLRGEITKTSHLAMYTRGKLSNFYFTRALADKGYKACTLHVGVVATSIWTAPSMVVGGFDVGAYAQAAVSWYMGLISRDVEQGSRGIVRCALDDDPAVTGGAYLDGGGNPREDWLLPPCMKDMKTKERLMEVSEMFWQKGVVG